jgi:hypothetical protein
VHSSVRIPPISLVVLPFWLVYVNADPPTASAAAAAFIERLVPQLPPGYTLARVAQHAVPKGPGAPEEGAVFGSLVMQHPPEASSEDLLRIVRDAFRASNTTEPPARLAIGSEPTPKDFFS